MNSLDLDVICSLNKQTRGRGCGSTHMVRRSCRLCRRLAILSARSVGLDLFVFTKSAEYCSKERKNTQWLFNFQHHVSHWLVSQEDQWGSDYNNWGKGHKSNMAMAAKLIHALTIFRCLPTGWLADSLCRGRCKWISCCFRGLWSCSEPWPQRGIDGPEVSDMLIRSGTAPSHTGTTHRVMWWEGKRFVFRTNRDPFSFFCSEDNINTKSSNFQPSLCHFCALPTCYFYSWIFFFRWANKEQFVPDWRASPASQPPALQRYRLVAERSSTILKTNTVI